MTRFFIVCALALLASDSTLSDQTVWFLEAECRGDFVDIIANGTLEERDILAAFMELRRRGEVPSFSREWCIERGILPVRDTGKQSS